MEIVSFYCRLQNLELMLSTNVFKDISAFFSNVFQNISTFSSSNVFQDISAFSELKYIGVKTVSVTNFSILLEAVSRYVKKSWIFYSKWLKKKCDEIFLGAIFFSKWWKSRKSAAQNLFPVLVALKAIPFRSTYVEKRFFFSIG